MKVSVAGYVPRGETKAQTLKEVDRKGLERLLRMALFTEAIEAGDKKRRITVEIKVEDVK